MALQLPLLDPRDIQAASSRRSVRDGAARDGAARRRGPQGPPAGPARAPHGSPSPRTTRESTAPAPRPGDSPYWRLDEHTRQLGLRGVEDARRALAAAVQRTGRATAA